MQFMLPHTWTELAVLRDRIADGLTDLPETVRSAAVLVASELSENAMKYGEAVPGVPTAVLSLTLDGTRLRIEVVNGTRHMGNVSRVREVLDRIAHTDSIQRLFEARLREILLNPQERESRLGFLRVAFDTRFELSCDYENHVLTITAIKDLTDGDG